MTGAKYPTLADAQRLGVGLCLAYFDGDFVAVELIRGMAADAGVDLLGFLAGVMVGLAEDGVFDVSEWRKHALSLAGVTTDAR